MRSNTVIDRYVAIVWWSVIAGVILSIVVAILH